MKQFVIRAIAHASTWLFALTLPCIANAGILVTLSNDGTGGTIANFSGSGTTSGSSLTSEFFNLGNVTSTTGIYLLSDPVAFSPGIDIKFITLDDDSTNPNPADDFQLIYSALVPEGAVFSTSGSSFVEGLAFAELIPGIYTSSVPGSVLLGDFRLIVEECSPFPGGGATGGCFPGPGPFPGQPVPEPSTLGLLGIGLLGLGLMRRKRAA